MITVISKVQQQGWSAIDLHIVPLFAYTDVYARILRSIVPPETRKSVVLRASGANSTLTELSNEAVAVSIEDALRLNVSAMAATGLYWFRI